MRTNHPPLILSLSKALPRQSIGDALLAVTVQTCGVVSNCRQAVRGFKAWARQVPKTEASVILVSVPWTDRVPPLIFRLITTGRRLRSAALLSGGAPGSATKTKSSLMCFSMRRHSLA